MLRRYAAISVMLAMGCGVVSDASPAEVWTRKRGMKPGKAVDPNAACVRLATVAEIAAYAGGAKCIYLTHATAYGRWDWQATTCGANDGIACSHGAGGRYWQRAMGTPRTWLPRYVYAAGDTDDGIVLKLTTASKDDVGGVVQLDRVYTLAKTMYVYSGVTYRGNGIRRACSPVSVITAPASIGETCLTVDTTTGWMAGDTVTVVPDTSYRSENALYATAAGTPSGPTALCLATGLLEAASAGWKVTRVYPQITQIAPDGSAGPTPGMVLEDMEIDGNAGCNAVTHDWRYNDVGAIRGATARRVYVHDTPSEAFTVCGSTVTDSRFSDLAGSIVHKSCPEVGHDDVVARNIATNVNTVGDAVMGHSEGAITLSANCAGLTIYSNTFTAGGEGVIGYANVGDEGIVAYGNTLSSFPRMIEYDALFDRSTVAITGNVCTDVPGCL